MIAIGVGDWVWNLMVQVVGLFRLVIVASVVMVAASAAAGQGPRQEETCQVRVTVGDHSDSASEQWRLFIGRESLTAPTGDVISKVFVLPIGQVYEIRVEHLGSTLPVPDYDYTAHVEVIAPNSASFLVDSEGLLGEHLTEGGPNHAAGKVAALYLPQVRIERVEFRGNELGVVNDELNIEYDPPHWLDLNGNGSVTDPGDHDYPAAYLCSVPGRVESLTLSANLVVKPAGTIAAAAANGISIGVRGVGPNSHGWEVEWSAPQTPPPYPPGPVSVLGDTIRLVDVQPRLVVNGDVTNNPVYLPTTIHAWAYTLGGAGPFTIDWSVRFADSPLPGNWVEVGQTQSEVFVVGRERLPSVRYHHTLVHLAATECHGLDADTLTPAQAIGAIWPRFTGRTLVRYGGLLENPPPLPPAPQLWYYWDWTCDNITTADLLSTGDGQCGAWVSLLLDALKILSIQEAGNLVKVVPPSGHVLLVNNWTTIQPPWTSDLLGYSFRIVARDTNGNATWFDRVGAAPNQSYDFAISDLSDLSGVHGQGPNANPASIFDLHFYVQCAGGLYDPSYGVTYGSNLLFESGSVFAIGPKFNSRLLDETAVPMGTGGATSPLDLNGDGMIMGWVAVPLVYTNGNAPGQQLMFLSLNY